MPASTTALARERLAAIGIAPRGLSLEEAAAYVGLSPGRFLVDVEAGRYPPPTRHGKRQVWDRRALDRAMDTLSGLARPRQDAASLHEAMLEAIESDA